MHFLGGVFRSCGVKRHPTPHLDLMISRVSNLSTVVTCGSLMALTVGSSGGGTYSCCPGSCEFRESAFLYLQITTFPIVQNGVHFLW